MSIIAIIAPHQDDEILSCTYVMKQAIERGDEVLVAFITNGDYEGKKYTDIRAVESVTSLQSIGVKTENIIFFGYGDSTISRLFYSKENSVVKSKFSASTYSPKNFRTFHNRMFGSETDYTRNGLIFDLTEFFYYYTPEKIYCPCGFDVHVDHKGTFLFLQLVLQKMNKDKNYCPDVYTYLIHILKHALYWPIRIGLDMKRPLRKHIGKELWEQRVIVRGEKERLVKQNLISNFVSQKPRAAYGFLYSFAKKEEVFWKGDFFNG